MDGTLALHISHGGAYSSKLPAPAISDAAPTWRQRLGWRGELAPDDRGSGRSHCQSHLIMIMTPDSETVCLFEWLALTEAVGFEDWDFAVALSEVMEESLLGFEGGNFEFLLPHAAKRLLVMSQQSMGGLASMNSCDIACIRMPREFEDRHPAAAIGPASMLLATPHLRTCLSWRCRPGETGSTAKRIGAPLWVEWTAPGSDAYYCSGLMFAGQWRTGVSAHTSKIIARYMTTLSPKQTRHVNYSVAHG